MFFYRNDYIFQEFVMKKFFYMKKDFVDINFEIFDTILAQKNVDKTNGYSHE